MLFTGLRLPFSLKMRLLTWYLLASCLRIYKGRHDARVTISQSGIEAYSWHHVQNVPTHRLPDGLCNLFICPFTNTGICWIRGNIKASIMHPVRILVRPASKRLKSGPALDQKVYGNPSRMRHLSSPNIFLDLFVLLYIHFVLPDWIYSNRHCECDKEDKRCEL